MQRNKKCSWGEKKERLEKEKKSGIMDEPHKTELYLTEILFFKEEYEHLCGDNIPGG